MKDTGVFLSGELAEWPSTHNLAGILQAAGLHVVIGSQAVRVTECEHFVFQSLGGSPAIDADAGQEETLLKDALLVSNALALAKIRHRFEIYGATNNILSYLHYEWPQGPTSTSSRTADARGLS